MAKLAWFVLNGCNITLMHVTKWFNGESCVNVGSSTVAAMSDDSGGGSSSSCDGCGWSGDTGGSCFNVGNGGRSSCVCMMEEFRGGWGSDDNCSSAVIWGEAMMAVVRCSGGSCDNLSGGGNCISAIEVKYYHYDTTNCHKCHQCTSPLPSLPQQTTPVQLA